MSRIKKSKKQVIVVPTTPKSVAKTKSARSLSSSLKKVRSVPAKTNTLAYYNCLIDQIASPANAKAKITSLAHHCKCNKSKVALVQQEHKQQLLKEVAQNYQAFGQSLGHYLQADIMGCIKELKKK